MRSPQIRGPSSTRRVGPLVGASPGASSNSFALFCGRDFSLRGKGECDAGPSRVRGAAEGHELLHRALPSAINQATASFEEAQSDHLASANSRDW